MKNTILKRAHGGGVIFHRISLSHNDLYSREGVKHDFGKIFFDVKEYGQNTTLLFNLHYS